MSGLFPGESPEYRAARDRLLEAEVELRRQTEAVAAMRRTLPPGGAVAQDYAFVENGDGAAPHLAQQVAVAVVASSPEPRIRAFARERGWRHLRLISSARTTYNRDYHGETSEGSQIPMLNVFTRHNGQVRHFWGSELLQAPREPGQDPRHVDFIWPIWNVLDATPEGRGTDWSPLLEYT